MTATNDNSAKKKRATPSPSSPVVVSAEAEALSHSATTMKLTPSYQLFRILDDDEGGAEPGTMSGNSKRDGSVLRRASSSTMTDDANGDGEGVVAVQEKVDTLRGVKMSDYVGLGGKVRIETLPDPFKMVKEELQPFTDSIKELVSTDQPVLSMAAKHFFEKRHGKRFRPTIVQLMSKVVAAAKPETMADHGGEEGTDADDMWEWSGASKI